MGASKPPSNVIIDHAEKLSAIPSQAEIVSLITHCHTNLMKVATKLGDKVCICVTYVLFRVCPLFNVHKRMHVSRIAPATACATRLRRRS